MAPPTEKSPKTNEKSMIRALEPPGTSPKRFGSAQDRLKARSSHPRAPSLASKNGFWLIFRPKMEPHWCQNGLENRCQLRKAIFPKKIYKTNIKSMILGFSGGRSWEQKSIKKRSKMECILASIFGRFWVDFGAKLGRKIDQKSIQKSIEKTM